MLPLPVLNCDNCGMCCVTQGTPPFAYTPDDSPPAELSWNVEQHAARYDKSLPCLWYNESTKKCNHYEHRPKACRDAVNPGDEYCLEFRKNL